MAKVKDAIIRNQERQYADCTTSELEMMRDAVKEVSPTSALINTISNEIARRNAFLYRE